MTERSIVLGKKSGLDSIRIKADELGLDVPEERRAEMLAAVKKLGTEQARARHRRRVQEDRRVAEYDAIIVGSGVNGLACAALLAKAGWGVCVLERNDWFGGAIRTAEITEPGFKHDVFSAWHPLWVGGAVHAQLGDELARHGLEYLNTDLPDRRRAFPDGESAFLLRTADATRELEHSGRRRLAACSTRSSRPRTSRSACSAPSCGRSTARRSG